MIAISRNTVQYRNVLRFLIRKRCERLGIISPCNNLCFLLDGLQHCFVTIENKSLIKAIFVQQVLIFGEPTKQLLTRYNSFLKTNIFDQSMQIRNFTGSVKRVYCVRNLARLTCSRTQESENCGLGFAKLCLGSARNVVKACIAKESSNEHSRTSVRSIKSSEK